MDIHSIIVPSPVVQNIYLQNLNVVGSLALSVWDVLLTIDNEIQYIWKAKYSWVSIFFGINRVLTIGGQIIFVIVDLGTLQAREPFCRGFYWFRLMYGVVLFVFADVVLVTRLFAFYGRDTTLVVFLCVLEVLGLGGVMGLIAFAIPRYELIPNSDPGNLRIGTCIPLGYPSIEPDLWIPLLVIQSIFFGFSIGRHVYLQRHNLLLRNTALVTPSIYQIFIRDGVWAFFVLFLDLLLCVIGTALHSAFGAIPIQWSYSLNGICISRLILNLRHSAHKQSQYSRIALSTISDVAFKENESIGLNSAESLGN